MRFRLPLVTWFLLLAAVLAAPLAAQSTPAAQSKPARDGQRAPGNRATTADDRAAAVATDDLNDVLDRGRTLESDRRWGEALTLYEDALRLHPSDRHLEQRLRLSRIHYDLGRRYADHSYRDALAALSPRAAQELYGEVLLKIQSHYVDAPDWRQLAEYGTTGLELALADPLFVECHLGSVPASRANHFRRQLRDLLARHELTSRQSVQNLAAAAARLAHGQLGLPEAVVVLEYTCGATNSLDSYSAFLTASQLNEVYSQIEGNFVGLGIELKAADGALLIVKVITGSPAERGGILPGDKITEVDGQSTAELSTDQAANLLQGREGSLADVTLVSPGRSPRQLRIRREHVEVPSIDDARIEDESLGIAYLKLTCFQKTTTRDLNDALWKLHGAGMKSLIIDLRGNPGGLLTTAVDVVDKFVDRGVIVSTRGRSRQEDASYSARESGTWRVPLVVLIDGDSASASEIFAGAIRDHRRGTIVGTRSYGKGSVQGIFPLGQASTGLRLTTAKFYSPKGKPYSGIGVTPDVVVPPKAVAHHVARPDLDDDQPLRLVSPAAPDRSKVDDALETAKGIARQQLARR
ncbi:MAG TPA: S41 family peptidase [Pirellulales bacterium]|nr:S41 family peptidase [Pirellulales bacterium]